MAPFRGRGAPRGSAKLVRSGIRTRAGYRKFDSQRIKDVEPVDSEDERFPEREDVDQGANGLSTQEDEEEDEEEGLRGAPQIRAYNALLYSLHQTPKSDLRRPKRQKLEEPNDNMVHSSEEQHSDSEAALDVDDDELHDAGEAVSVNMKSGGDDGEDEECATNPFEVHFANPDHNELSRRLKAVQAGRWVVEKRTMSDIGQFVLSVPDCEARTDKRHSNVTNVGDFSLKTRLLPHAESRIGTLNPLQRAISPYIIHYRDLMVTTRTPYNAQSLREIACVHAINHVLKGRDRILKNSARLSHSENQDLEVRDQGFTRPKVLILLETRQMCMKYANTIVEFFAPDHQENRQRFDASFVSPIEERSHLPADFNELFDGNNDNNFLTALKLNRKALKFYSPFYSSDIVIASPLGLRRILENEDPKKRDYDFLSSIEMVVVDQADAMQMQNWENVECVFRHLNLQLKEAHGCDFNRVRSWYLDGYAKHLRQTIVFSAYLTPEMNNLFNSSMENVAGKMKLVSMNADGAIASAGGLDLKQTFARFDSPSPAGDPDARFKYFTSTVLPAVLRLPKPADGAKGLLIFVPSYYDFLRVRNFFATSTLTENISFGAIHDYSDVSSQRRARSHFVSGRHSILLYTQRAHHFYRLKMKGVKRVVIYGLPDNPIFYEELVAGFLGTTLEEGTVDPAEASVKAMFSKWDGLRLERVVGRDRVKGMLGGKGDTFDFV